MKFIEFFTFSRSFGQGYPESEPSFFDGGYSGPPPQIPTSRNAELPLKVHKLSLYSTKKTYESVLFITRIMLQVVIYNSNWPQSF